MPEPSRAPTERFSDRVDDYVRYRPGYPADLFAWLQTCLPDAATGADVGSGTGIFTAPLLNRVPLVWAIEPNAAMRAAAEAWLGDRAGFQSVAGTAERTGLPDGCVDLVACAQAFHWFDRAAARREFGRILRPGGAVLLVWNDRDAGAGGADPFAAGYEALLTAVAPEYPLVAHRNLTDDGVAAFFSPVVPEKADFPNAQHLDLPGLIGRVLSSSYAPKPGTPGHPELLAGLERLFRDHARAGAVTLRYRTRAFLGRCAHDKWQMENDQTASGTPEFPSSPS